jgi:hypothetical protein
MYLFVVYFVWWARNSSIFQNKFIPDEAINGLISKLSRKHLHKEKAPKPRIVEALQINKEVPWSYFDEASRGHPA